MYLTKVSGSHSHTYYRHIFQVCEKERCFVEQHLAHIHVFVYNFSRISIRVDNKLQILFVKNGQEIEQITIWNHFKLNKNTKNEYKNKRIRIKNLDRETVMLHTSW